MCRHLGRTIRSLRLGARRGGLPIKRANYLLTLSSASTFSVLCGRQQLGVNLYGVNTKDRPRLQCVAVFIVALDKVRTRIATAACRAINGVDAHGLSLHAEMRCGAHQRKHPKLLCCYIARPAIAKERRGFDLIKSPLAYLLLRSRRSPVRIGPGAPTSSMT